ncbi:hypothetical protein L228DRAFT_247932 [Xylona heveae TC161]|uniref:Pyrroline-5-carboxylate reductase n=1 Tax=Xylona heveae (strain CBS 132557 / TC161) TaxID=1328760 RepID=A0A165GJT6_XYLHT|nr:hypothetical protein L228DRAFT_247932 [Xylona heveae TC161]KZF22278.1 hypothetical protein L228DRAFT_247932 [Xylona heveae TC161]
MAGLGDSPLFSKPVTLAVVGCGAMGTAVLSGVLDSITSFSSASSSSSSSPRPQITEIIATTASLSSAQRLQSLFHPTHESKLTVLHGPEGNLSAIRSADVILLGCKPKFMPTVLKASGVADALKGKVLISILAGVPPRTIMETIYDLKSPKVVSQSGQTMHELSLHYGIEGALRRISYSDERKASLKITRGMPNMGAQIRESMSVLEDYVYPPPSTGLAQFSTTGEGQKVDEAAESKAVLSFTNFLFQCIGRTHLVDPTLFDLASVLIGTTGAFIMPALDGILDGCVAEGMRRSDAHRLLAHSILGQVKLLLSPQEGGTGDHPALMRERVASPGGNTIRGLLALEQSGVRSAYAGAVMASMDRTRELAGKK